MEPILVRMLRDMLLLLPIGDGGNFAPPRDRNVTWSGRRSAGRDQPSNQPETRATGDGEQEKPGHRGPAILG